MIDRKTDTELVGAALRRSRVVALVGPRQSGKPRSLANWFGPTRLALADLKLDELRVVYPGKKRYPLAEKVEFMPLAELVSAK